MKPTAALMTAMLALAIAATDAHAQTTAPAPKSAPDATAKANPEPAPSRPSADMFPERTLLLRNVGQGNEANEVYTALRNALQASDKSYLVPSQNAIIIRAPEEDVQLAQKIIEDLDKPKKTYRLSYTVTEVDGTKPVGVQHYAMVVASGQPTTMKEGSKVPLVTGGPSDANSKTQTSQVTYIDVGMTFDVTVVESGAGVELRSYVEQSSIAPGVSGVGPQDPVVRMASVKGEALLTPGKPVTLGSMDIPGSTRHLDIEVVMGQLP